MFRPIPFQTALANRSFLSQDRHEHATTAFPSPSSSPFNSTVIEFSTSALSQFYQPFERQYRQEEDTDVELYSHPHGISKFGVLEFDNRGEQGEWTMDFSLVVNGERVWGRRVAFKG